MHITIKDNSDRCDIINELHSEFEGSRFDIFVEVPSRGKKIIIRNIRLKDSKHYCGNHPAECLVEGAGRKGKWLEGADWVEFNDRINDVLDRLNVSANVATAVCKLRKERRRRINYGMFQQGRFNQWLMDEPDNHYADYCGKIAPASTYPEGTPGYYERKVA